jgi:hypothetical protein
MLTQQTCAVVQFSARIRVNIIYQFFKPEVFILVIPRLTPDDYRIFSQNWQKPLLLTTSTAQ